EHARQRRDRAPRVEVVGHEAQRRARVVRIAVIDGDARLRARRQKDAKDAAAAARILDGDLAAVRLDQLLDDRQANARAARAGVHRRAPLLEAAEQALLQIVVDADAGVAHGDGDAAGIFRELDVDRAARRRELDGVGDEVGDDALELLLVDVAHAAGRAPKRDAEPLLLGDGAPGGDDDVEEPRQIDGGDLQAQLALAPRGEDEQIVDEAEQLARRHLDAVELLQRARVERAAETHLDVADGEVHQRQRRADLVVDVGEDAIANFLRLLEAAHGLRQLIARLHQLGGAL